MVTNFSDCRERSRFEGLCCFPTTLRCASAQPKPGRVGHRTRLFNADNISHQIPFHFMQILASGDDSGIINIWKLGGGGDGLIHLKKIDSHVDMAGGSSVTTLSLWNKVNQGDL